MINLNKRLLAKIPIEKANDKIISLAKRTEEEYLISAEIVKSEQNKILLLYFYQQPSLKDGNTKAAFRVFISKDNYITQDLKATRLKWRTACIDNLVGGWKRWLNQCIIIDDKTSNKIKSFLGTDNSPLEAIEHLQSSIMAKRLEKKHKVTKDRIDNQMNLVPDLPKGFESWVDKTALFKSRYIFYKYKQRKKLEGYCTNCKSDVIVEAPRHNVAGICPKCKSPIVYKAMGKSKNVVDRGQASLIQRVGDKVIVRYFSTYKSYQNNYKEPEISFCELARDFYDKKGNTKSYEYMNFKQSGETRWCDGEGKFGFHNAVLYEKNLDNVLKGTIWQYSAIKLFATHTPGFGFQTFNYLEQYIEHPLIEYLVKSKLYKLTNQVIYKRIYSGDDIDLRGKKLESILNINKKQFVTAQRINAGKNELDVIRKVTKAKLNITDEQILFISKYLNVDKIMEMTKYTTIHKMIKYIKSNTTNSKKEDDIYRDWIDYIRFCKDLNYDLMNEFVLYPKNLVQEHDRLMGLVLAKKDKERAEKLERQKKKIKIMAKELAYKYSMEYKDLVIIAPKNANEIIKEGQKLHHCVGSYIDRIAEGESIVLFIRNKKELKEPYCTLEVINGEITQCRGKYNENMKEKLKTLLERFNKLKLSEDIKREAV